MKKETKEVRTSKVPSGISNEFLRIMNKELRLSMNHSQRDYNIMLKDPERFLRITQRLLSVAENSTVLRCIGNMGHLTDDKTAHESVAAHTNLAIAIMEEFLLFAYGWHHEPPNYSRKVINLGLRIHDLPENITGDKPDNDESKRAEKEAFEHSYYQEYLSLYSEDELDQNDITTTLNFLIGMHTLKLPEERAGYLSDKTSAFLEALMLDKKGLYPYAYFNDPAISVINHAEMNMCNYRTKDGGYLLSEVWTNDCLFARELYRYDDTGFFTALTVMATLFCHNGKWYNWREEQYFPN